MVPPGAFSKQLESGHEFTRKRLVEMEGVFFLGLQVIDRKRYK